jgi:restriction-modification enzyme MmeI-like protein
MREIRIHTNFPNTIAETSVFQLADLNAFEVRQKLRWAFTDPERLRPDLTREKVTAAAATAFGRIAQKLIGQGHERKRVAHFLNKLVFCLFAEDIELLPERVFADILGESVKQPDLFAPMLADLFRAMRERNGRFGTLRIPWFNGGLFDDDDVPPLHLFEIRAVAEAARLDWSAIEPSIFGTLFERGLDPEKRKQMASEDQGRAGQGGRRPERRGAHPPSQCRA